MKNEPEQQNDDELSLKDVVEAGTLPEEKSGRGGKKKKLLMVAVLGVLLVVTTAGAYFLLGGKEVHVKANRKPAEKVTNGADLQKAAYDSLRGSLDTSVTGTTAGTPATNIGSAQPTTIAITGVTGAATPAAESSTSPRATPSAQPGIALTLAPPAEFAATKQAGRNQPAGETRADSTSASDTGRVAASGSAAPKVKASIIFAAPPNVAKRENAKPEAAMTLSRAEEQQPENGVATPVLKRAQKASSPSFGTMLPIRSMGVLYTLRAGGLARFELARDIRTENWLLKRGTIFVGSVLTSELDRAYVQVKGFIDPDTKGFKRLEGEILGSDGGAGLRGKRRRVSPAWIKVLDRAAQSGTQILTGVLSGRNSSVIVATDPYGAYRSTNYDQAQFQSNRTFVEVPAGTVGFVLVTTLPEPDKPNSHLADVDRTKEDAATNSLPDDELAELLAEADPEKIRAAMPRMNPELRRVAATVLKEIEKR